MNNYLPDVLRKSASAAGKPGVYSIEVRHDDWCAVFQGGQCNCEPEVDDPHPWPATEEQRP